MTSNPVPSGSACRDIEHHYHEGHYHEGRYGAGRYDPDGHAGTNWPTEGEAGDEQTAGHSDPRDRAMPTPSVWREGD